MSFSWSVTDAHGRDLLKEFGVTSHQMLGLGPHGPDATDAPHSVSEIRSAFIERATYADRLTDAARDAVAIVQSMARENLESLTPAHCDTCTCPAQTPKGWSVKEITNLLAIPLERVHRASGGY